MHEEKNYPSFRNLERKYAEMITRNLLEEWVMTGLCNSAALIYHSDLIINFIMRGKNVDLETIRNEVVHDGTHIM